MYKVIVVDDELYVRRGIIQAIQWEFNKLDFAGEAENAEEALLLAEQVKPDIVITDMKMPGIGGIGLIQKLKDRLPATKVIVISAYSDFDYTREAIINKVFDYVLKPIKKDELNKVILSCTNEIESAGKLQNISNETSIPLPKIEKLVENLLYNHKENVYFDNQERMLIERSLGYPLLQCLVYKIDHLPKSTEPSSEQDLYIMLKATLDNHLKSLKQSNISCISRVKKELIAVVGDEATELETIQGVAKNAIADCKMQYHVGMSVGIGATVTSPYDLFKSYDQAQKIIRSKKLKETGAVLSYQEPVTDKFLGLIDLNTTDRIFLNSLQKGNVLDAQRLFRLSMEEFSSGDITVYLLQKKTFLFLEEIEKLLNRFESNMDIECGKSSIQHIDELMVSFRLEEIYEIFDPIIRNIASFFQIRSKKGGKQVVDQIIKMIYQEYCQQISINNYAEKYYMNADYLGRIFKNETGKSFGDFLTEVRINKAKQLLQNNITQHYYEIAESVGYKDYRYFCKVFKDLTGLTPGEYSEQFNRNHSM